MKNHQFSPLCGEIDQGKPLFAEGERKGMIFRREITPILQIPGDFSDYFRAISSRFNGFSASKMGDCVHFSSSWNLVQIRSKSENWSKIEDFRPVCAQKIGTLV